ncbi:MAG TPA: hypothetical protein VG406_21980 [Isosphaeraceae bacterium]|jgi:hypothetical protein|nr:hypothetical protein [Isosphaeraceae bacterium]
MIPLIGFFTDYAKNLENNLWHLGTAATPPATLYLGLGTGDPLRSGAPAELSAATNAGYARVAAPAASWGTSTGGLVTNAATITLGPNSGSSPWQTAYCLFATDAATGGNVIWICRLAPDTSGMGQTLAVGKKLSFAPGAISIQK